MSINMSVQIQGEVTLQGKFKKLGKAARITILTAAAKAAGKPMRDGVRRRAPRRASGGGNLQREIRAVVQERTEASVTVRVGWRRGTASRTPAFYGLFQDQGTAQRARKSGGSTGRVAARNFLKQAFEAERKASEAAAARVLLAAINKAVR